MKTLLKYIIIVFIGFIFVDLITRFAYHFAYTHVPKNAEIIQRYKYIYNQKQADILITGASRGMFSYNAPLIEKITGMSIYNTGEDGAGVINQYLCLLNALKNGPIKYMIYDIGDLQLTNKWNQGRISRYYPHYWLDSNVKKVVDDCVGLPKAEILLSSSLFQFNSHLHDLARIYFVKNKNNETGYEGLPYTGKPCAYYKWDRNKPVQPFIPDSLPLAYLNKIVNICKNNNITLILTMAPALSNEKSSAIFLNKYSKEKNIPFWDFTDCPEINKDPRLYKDDHHLNEKGTPIFAKILCDSLKKHYNI